MDPRQVITSDSDIMGGIPVFAGTRVPVDSLTAHLRGGSTIDEFLDDFPSVVREQVEGYLLYAEQLVSHEAVGQ